MSLGWNNGKELADLLDDVASGRLSRAAFLRRAGALGLSLPALSGLLAAGAHAATPKRGGTFRLGVPGGSPDEWIDGQTTKKVPDVARLLAGFETLVTTNQANKVVFDGLAEEVTATRPDVWTIRVRQGIEFHNGKTLSADDVIYSLRRMVDPKLALNSGSGLQSIDPRRIRKLDKRTVRLFLKYKDVSILGGLAYSNCGIVPVGYSPGAVGKANPNVGTGPYKLQAFNPGERSFHIRNPNYWRTGEPYFNSIVIIDFPDANARVNALLGGQIDAAADVPAAQIPAVANHSGTKVLESPSARWTPICMRVDAPPFNDVRVRRAMRLIVDRPQMIRQAVAGHGSIGNDLYSPIDQAYFRTLPQRHQDIEQAKSLLKAAGQSDLRIDLQSTGGSIGQNEGAQVFAEQAKAAGVTVNVKLLDSATFYGPQYLKWTFSTDYWSSRSYFFQSGASSLPTSPYNETHWPDPAHQSFVSLRLQALGTLDEAKRIAILHEMQKMEYDAGGYIIWGFLNLIDGYNTKLQGLKTGLRSTYPLNEFGHGFRTLWFA